MQNKPISRQSATVHFTTEMKMFIHSHVTLFGSEEKPIEMQANFLISPNQPKEIYHTNKIKKYAVLCELYIVLRRTVIG